MALLGYRMHHTNDQRFGRTGDHGILGVALQKTRSKRDAPLSMKHLLLSLFVLLACGHKSLDRRHEIPSEDPNGDALTGAFVVMADNQIHHLFGDPYWMRSRSVDRVVSVAIRPPQLDLFAPDLLRWVLSQESSAGKPVLHLGDALDIACEGELDMFFTQMRHASAGWFMAPGNHDFYFVGNGHVSEGNNWARACTRAGGPLTKDEFILRYIDQGLGSQGTRPDVQQLRLHRQASPCETRFDSSGGLLTGLRWELDHDEPWRSFLVQRLDLSRTASGRRVVAVLVDTTQYKARPRIVPALGRNAGLKGNLLRDQREAVEELLASAREQGAVVVLMGHHPYGSLTKSSRKFVAGLVADYNVVAYVSGHTHKGHYAVHGAPRTDDDAPAETFLELNVGSLIDWPLEYRELWLKTRDAPPGRDPALVNEVVVASPRVRLHQRWSERQEGMQCDPKWERAPEHYVTPDGSGYGRTSVDTQKKLFGALLDTFEALLVTFPSEAGTGGSDDIPTDGEALAVIERARTRLTNIDEQDLRVAYERLDAVAETLRQLEQFDGARTPQNPEARDTYRLCQALWASKYDRLRFRAPIADDAFVVVPVP